MEIYWMVEWWWSGRSGGMVGVVEWWGWGSGRDGGGVGVVEW